MASDLHLRSPATAAARRKPNPKQSAIPIPFVYHASDDGTDENLLILLHGLGDTHVPFGRLGQQLKLPQTATLALRAPEQIPFLYEQAYQWYTSFDPLGELLDRPNPTSAIELLRKVLDHLVEECNWPPQRIHFFGFAQGGTVAVETGLQWWQSELEKQRQADGQHVPQSIGSIVTISGPLLSYPTHPKPCTTPLLVFQRPPPSDIALPNGAITAFKKGYSHLVEVSMPGDGMPRSKQEWEPIMRLWSERLGKRPMEGLYEVMSGMAP